MGEKIQSAADAERARCIKVCVDTAGMLIDAGDCDGANGARMCAETLGLLTPADESDTAAEIARLSASNERLRNVVELERRIWNRELEGLTSAVMRIEAERDALRAANKRVTAECDAMRESIAGRTTGPTRAEQDAHDERGGYWMIEQRGLRLGRFLVCSSSALRFHLREIEAVGGSLLRVWSLDASGAPCAWPVVTEVSRG